MNSIASVFRSTPVRLSRAGAPPVKGLSLIFALLALGVLTLAAVALVRSVDTGALVLGNMGFKQDATATGDQVADAAITWLANNTAGSGLNSDDDAANGHGYIATAVDLDPTGSNTSNASRAVIDWANDGSCAAYGSGTFARCIEPAAGPTINGHSTQYVIVRLCPSTGAPTTGTNDCASPPAGSGGSGGGTSLSDSTNSSEARNGFDYNDYERFQLPTSGSVGTPYFRVIARIVGGRKSVSYTETIVHF